MFDLQTLINLLNKMFYFYNGYQYAYSPYFENTTLLVFGAMILKHFIVDFCIMFSISIHKTCPCSFFILRFANIA